MSKGTSSTTVEKYMNTPRSSRAEMIRDDGPSSKSKCNNISIQILYPLLFTLLLIASLGVNIILATLSHFRTVEVLVEDIHIEVGSRIVSDITSYFDVAANGVGDLRALTESGLVSPDLAHLKTSGNVDLFPSFTTRYLNQHPELFDLTIATESDYIEFIERLSNSEFLFYVRNATTTPDRWTLALNADGSFVNHSHVIKVKKDYSPTIRSWYTDVKAKTLGGGPKAVAWSAPYLWSDKSAIGMFCGSVNVDSDGRPVGVIGTDIVISNVKQFFKTIGLKGGTSFLIDANGGVFASSIDNVIFAEENAEGDLVIHQMLEALDPVKNSDVFPVVSGVIEHLGSVAWKNLSLSDTIKDHAIYIAPIDDTAKSGLHVLVMLPLGPFRDGVTDDVIVATIIAISLLVVSAVIAILFSVSMTRPLARASLALNHCATLDVDAVNVGRRSWIKEIASLQESTESLLAALSSFALYVPMGVVRSLMTSKTSAVAGMENAELTIFFCDIENFTDISHKLSAFDTSVLLAKYFSIITGHLEKNEATTDKFLGDGVLAFWGAPDPVSRRNKKAIDTILAIEQDIARHQKTSSITGGVPAPGLRIGIHDDVCLVGNIGTSTRLNYTVIGDAVNLASRLESLNKFFRSTHLVSEEVVSSCREDYIVRRVASVVVKGRVEATLVYTVLARTNDLQSDVTRATRLSQVYEASLSKFETGNFVAAAEGFRECKREFPNDGPSAAMAELSEVYANKRPDNFTGSIIMDVK